jgi:hypothetical protein
MGDCPPFSISETVFFRVAFGGWMTPTHVNHAAACIGKTRETATEKRGHERQIERARGAPKVPA